MNPSNPFPFVEDPRMTLRVGALEARLRQLEDSHKAHQEATKRSLVKINQLLKDMGAAINMILGRTE